MFNFANFYPSPWNPKFKKWYPLQDFVGKLFRVFQSCVKLVERYHFLNFEISLKLDFWRRWEKISEVKIERRLTLLRRGRFIFWRVVAKGKMLFFYFSTSRQFFQRLQNCSKLWISRNLLVKTPKYHVRKSTGANSCFARDVKEDCSLFNQIHCFKKFWERFH